MDYSLGIYNLWIVMVLILVPNIIYFRSKASERTPPSNYDMTPYEKLLDGMEMFTRIILMALSVFLPISLSGTSFLAGLFLILLGLLLYYLVWYAIFTTPIDKPVTKGIYRLSRHPGRITPLIIFVGMAIISESLIFLMISLLFISIHLSNYKVEERYHLEKYGKTYASYQNTTPQYFIK